MLPTIELLDLENLIRDFCKNEWQFRNMYEDYDVTIREVGGGGLRDFETTIEIWGISKGGRYKIEVM